MNYEKNNSSNIFKGKSIYLVIALCLIGIGIAAFVAYDKIQEDAYPSTDYSAESTPSEPDIIPPSASESLPPADNVDTEKDDEPYESGNPSTPEPTATNFVMPILGNVAKHYSDDKLIYSATYKDMRLHTGIDIAAKKGDVVKSCGTGKIVAVIDDAVLGKYVEIDHGNKLIARYCGLDSILVKEGESVTAITKLGTVGTVTSECLDESHLHLEFYKDEIPVNPLSIIYPED